MGLEEGGKGTPTIGTSVADLFASQTILKHYSTWIFFNNLQTGDSFEIVIYVNDPNATAAERIYDRFTVNGSQTNKPATFIPFIPTDSYRITAQKLAGTDREIRWVRYESN